MKYIFLIPLLTILYGCGSTYERPMPAPSPSAPLPPAETTDLSELQNSLGLRRSHQELGYSEKTFNPCDVGLSQSDCRRRHFVVIHFQLMCSNAEGTTSVIQRAEDMQPVSDQAVRWTLKNLNGIVQTDAQGYGQIRAIAPGPQGQQRLKLTVGNQFLYTRAQELTRVATPPVWCRQFSVSGN